MTDTTIARKALIDFFEKWGLDANNIPEHDATATGYREYVIDKEGRRVIDPSGDNGYYLRTGEKAWPDGFPVDEAFRLRREFVEAASTHVTEESK